MTVSAPTPPRFGSWMGSMWLYTLLRFGLFFALWGLLVLIGVYGYTAALIAVVLSIPLSLILLSRPRRRFAANIEARMAQHREHRAHLDAELDPDHHDNP